jgi:hypothetical protein
LDIFLRLLICNLKICKICTTFREFILLLSLGKTVQPIQVGPGSEIWFLTVDPTVLIVWVYLMMEAELASETSSVFTDSLIVNQQDAGRCPWTRISLSSPSPAYPITVDMAAAGFASVISQRPVQFLSLRCARIAARVRQ